MANLLQINIRDGRASLFSSSLYVAVVMFLCLIGLQFLVFEAFWVKFTHVAEMPCVLGGSEQAGP